MPECSERKTLSDFQDLFKNKLDAKLCPDQQLPDFDPLAIAGMVMAGLSFMQDGNMHRRFRSLAFIEDMCCDDLLKKAVEEGVNPRPATSANGCVTITGNAGAVIPADIEFTGSGNITYRLDNSANPSLIGSDGTAVLCLTASEPGVDGNALSGGELQTFESYPEIDSLATIDDTGFFGGSDAEDCESVRSRLKARRQGIQACGTEEWYIDRVLEYPGVTRVCPASCECSTCGGCCRSGYLIMYPLFEGYPNGIAPQGVYDALTAHVFGTTAGNGSGLAPLGAQGEFQPPVALSTSVIIDADLSPNPAQLSSVANALSNWYSENLCVGANYCISELVAVIKNAAPALCIKSAYISGLGVTADPVSCPDTGQIPCGTLPVLDTINFI